MLATELTIRPAFKKLCRKLSKDERAQLTENIEQLGIQDPVKVWGDIVVDGHNRVEIAGELGVDFPIAEMHFETDEEAKEWIIKNQLGRRNLDESEASYLRGKLYNERKENHGGQRKNAQNPGKTSSAHSEHLKTAESVAEETGVSSATVRRDGKYAEAVDSLAPKAKQAIDQKEVQATKSEVIALAELEPDTQADVVEEVVMGDAETVKEAIESRKVVDPEAAKREQIACNRKLALDLIRRSVRAVDDLNEVCPGSNHKKVVDLIQAAGRLVW